MELNRSWGRPVLRTANALTQKLVAVTFVSLYEKSAKSRAGDTQTVMVRGVKDVWKDFASAYRVLLALTKPFGMNLA